MSLLSLIGRLSLNTDGFEAGLKKAESATSAFSSKLVAGLGAAAAAAFSVAAVKGMIDSINEAAIEVSQLAKRYELTTDEVQKLQKATGRLGLDFDNVAGAIGRIQKARSIAMGGGDDGAKAVGLFKALGISKTDALNPLVSAEAILEKIGSASVKTGQGISTQEALFELFGKNALVIKSIMSELKNLGPVKLIDSENINDAVEAMKQAKIASSEQKNAFVPLAAWWSRFSSGTSAEFRKGFANGFGGGPISAIMEGIISPLVEGFSKGWNGQPSTSAPSDAVENRVEEKRQMTRSEILSNARRTLLINSHPESGGFGNINPGGSGSLGNIGGYFFGSNVNNAIANNTLKAAGLLDDIKKDTADFRKLMGGEGGQ